MHNVLARTNPICLALGAALLAVAASAAEPGPVVINEIMYHAPGDLEDLQFIELHNAGKTECDLSGWHFSKGVKFKFPKGYRLAAGGFAVVCRNRAVFTRYYGKAVPLAGEFTGKLSHGGKKVELADAKDQAVDSVKFTDDAPWPIAADGHSSSLERICPTAPGDEPSNWAASNLPDLEKPGGTPGRANDSYSANPPPAIGEITLTPKVPKPEEPTTIEAVVTDEDGVTTVEVQYVVVNGQAISKEETVPMKRISGDSKSGHYQASLPAQPEGRIVRYRLRASDAAGTNRVSPMANELRGAWSYSTYTNTNTSKVPFGILLHPGKAAQPRGMARFGGDEPAPDKPRGTDAFIYIPPNGGEVQTFDFVQAPSRKAGYKVHFLKDQTLRGMTAVNIIFEQSPRQVLAEPLSYELYRLAGVPAELHEHLRFSVDGRWLGYHLLVEQPNKAFLKRNGQEPGGNLYKVIWYGNDVVSKHEKRTNVSGNHEDLLAAIKGLGIKDPEKQWAFIKDKFNVEAFVNYYVGNMCVSNWDGFFNNYFLYRALDDSGRWEIYPWDEDKTWGDYDGASSRYNWYSLPLNYGMTGNQRPAEFGGPTTGDSYNGWWRAPGCFSGPLLANPQFRKQFLTRLREVCTTIFTKEKLFPLIDAMEATLEGEVEFRAKVSGSDPAHALARFRADIQSFRDQVTNRRKFILDELDKLPR